MIDNFLNLYTKYNEGTEIPGIFALWCGLAGASAALGRRVWVNMGMFTLYPNLYVVLVAPSARNRKSTAIRIMETMLRELKPTPNIIAQQITPQAMIDALRFMEMVDSKGKEKVQEMRESGEGFVVADELVTFLNPTSYREGLGSLLLTFFDCGDIFTYKTKSGGDQIIRNICLGLLGGTTTNLLMEAIPEQAIGHGLTSRMIFIYADEKPKPVFWPKEDLETKKELGRQLKLLQEVRGECTFDPPAKQLLEDIYIRFFNTSPMYEDKFLSGYAGRRQTHHIKLCMLLSICEDGSLVVKERHVRGADLLLQRAEGRMGTVMEMVTATKAGDLLGQIRQTITNAKKISKADLLRKYNHKLTVREMDMYLDTLLAAGDIRSEAYAGQMYYKPKETE